MLVFVAVAQSMDMFLIDLLTQREIWTIPHAHYLITNFPYHRCSQWYIFLYHPWTADRSSTAMSRSVKIALSSHGDLAMERLTAGGIVGATQVSKPVTWRGHPFLAL